MKKTVCGYVAGLLFVLLLLAACSGKTVQKQSFAELLSKVEKTEKECAFTLLPWGTARDDVMRIQGWSEEDLEDIDGLEENSAECITKRLPVEELNADVRVISVWYGDGQLGASSYFLYFDEESEAEEYFNRLHSDYEAAIGETLTISTATGDDGKPAFLDFQFNVQPEGEIDSFVPMSYINVRYYGTNNVKIPLINETSSDACIVEIQARCAPDRTAE